jgi:hypothetical protein
MLSKKESELKVKELYSKGRQVVELPTVKERGKKYTAEGNQRARYFNNDWINKYEWCEVVTDEVTGDQEVFCFFCQARAGIGAPASTTQGGAIKNSEFVKGIPVRYKWIKEGNMNLERHEKSEHHRQSVSLKNEMESSTDIGDAFQQVSESSKKKNRRYIMKLLQAVLFLAANALAYRGLDESESSDNRGNFLNIVQFMRDNDKDFDALCDDVPKNATYTSGLIQNEMINALAEAIWEYVVVDVGESTWSVLVDECEDVSHHEQMGIGARYVDPNGVTREQFLGMVRVENTEAATLKKALVEFLKNRVGLNLNNIRGQGYDGASNMSGHTGGLQARMKYDHKYAHYVHCFGHKLNLAIDDTVSGVPVIHDFIETVRQARTLLTGSAKRHLIVENILKEVETIAVAEAEKYNPPKSGNDNRRKSQKNQKKSPFPEPSATRCWSGNQKLVDAMYDNVLVAYHGLNEIIDDNGTKPIKAAEMEGVLTKMLKFSFFFCTVSMQPVLKRMDLLSKHLQKQKIDLEEAQRRVLHEIEMVKESKGEFDKYWDLTKRIVEEANDELPPDDAIHIPSEDELHTGRRGRRSRGKGRAGVPGADVPPAQRSLTEKQHLKDSIYDPLHDTIIDELEKRFNGEGMKEIFAGLNAMSPRGGFAKFDVDKIVTFAEQYEDDFNLGVANARNDLKNDLKSWHRWMKRQDVSNLDERNNLTTIIEVTEFMAKSGDRDLHPKVFMLYERASTLPVTSVEIERSFSSMSYIKNCLRNRMGDERLCELVLLYKSPHIIKKIDMDKVVERWHGKQVHRRLVI